MIPVPSYISPVPKTHLVHIHIGLRARPSLEHHKREMIHEFTVNDLKAESVSPFMRIVSCRRAYLVCGLHDGLPNSFV